MSLDVDSNLENEVEGSRVGPRQFSEKLQRRKNGNFVKFIFALVGHGVFSSF